MNSEGGRVDGECQCEMRAHAKAVDLSIIFAFVGGDNDGNIEAKTACTSRLVQGRCQESAELCKRPALRHSGRNETPPDAGRRCTKGNGTGNQVPVHQPEAS